ncbi:MAG: hypothetical protein RLZZ476_651 [Verrucomicrobiota bacterium]|jgi:hypothetical protein
MKRLLTLLAVVMLSSANAEMRFWTNLNGQLVEAEMLGVNATARTVQVRLKNGQVAELPIAELSPPDREFAKTEWARLQTADSTPGANKFVSLPRSFAARFTAATRRQKTLESGVTVDLEPVVIRALDWLKSQQNPDGSWGSANKAAMTGFALQCFLGHGETPESEAYGPSVIKGLIYLIELAKKNPRGMLAEKWEAEGSGSGTYEHPIATVAMGEVYVTARLGSRSLPGLRECFVKAVTLIIEQQSDKGSWGYGGKEIAYNPQTGNDLSVANWHYLALHAAKKTSLKIDGLETACQKAVNGILAKQTRDGGFGGANRDAHYNQWSLSGGATAGLLLLDAAKAPTATKGLKFLSDFLQAEPPDWNTNCNLYCWHGYTHAFRLAPEAEWKNYASKVLPIVAAAQDSDGSFKRGTANWPAGDASNDIYRACLCTLILETPYRFVK